MKSENEFESQQEIFEWLVGGGSIERKTLGNGVIIAFEEGRTKVISNTTNNSSFIRTVSYSFDSPSLWRKVIN